ncbi:aminotransferase class I/II-fold pyridoxal phosphate-dependent enzyme [Flavobacterium suncheonense]|uniref:8-amino-7-oxononanoate synthase n=1 Tax=Flavobacterium suncheonense GH29-5 = DSM 17707 TaxID=1121899 RepID=A0A0A2MAG6_9FLAO|nr:pyridoxal phosphate-dependent aminotransferase family protein [Flavobacterium suncheonense]KGO89244.1 8-amino-7-oxononanoate synthase [Flavobacterium suncheonense GH29-5 = DSM 17707]
MKPFPKTLSDKLEQRLQNNSLRKLPEATALIDFSSNDYLGFAKSEAIFEATHQFLLERDCKTNGATGSRLLSGNHPLYEEAEAFIAEFHQAESALIFNSGYDANVGFFSAVPQRGDVILYDELIHASIRDGIQLSHAKAYRFAHNDLDDLQDKMVKFKNEATTVYVVIESVYSMDGDSPNLEVLTELCEQQECYLVVDEAHALGVFGRKGEGLIQSLQLQNKVFARIMTFGKGLGCHGAAILGSLALQSYLVNFSRSFVYTTGLSPHAVATIVTAYRYLAENPSAITDLTDNITAFNQEKLLLGLKPLFVYSKSAIQCAIIPGNERVKTIAAALQEKSFDVKPILSPTVPEGQERLRFCLHRYNTTAEITAVLQEFSRLVLGY